MRFSRAAGILLHPTSLPSPFGIGDLGPAAYGFVDFLVAARQSLWQILPLGPTGYGDSPYQSFSSFAGNDLIISPEVLVAQGYLPEKALADPPDFPDDRVDFGAVIDYKRDLIQQAYDHFQQHGSAEQQLALEKFEKAQDHWLDDYSLFMALKRYHREQNGGVWNHWPENIARRQPEAMKAWSTRLAQPVAIEKFAQFLFYEQWWALKSYANERGIRIIGDVPIFVAFDSTDVWANRHQFDLDEDGSPATVAGVPPDYFSQTGQRWGNPLYRWEEMAADGYSWWVERLRMTFQQVDVVRIDHFRGFEAFWEIPAEEPTAVVGRWVKGPGIPFFRKMREQLGALSIIAEDLGVITPEVEALRDEFSYPGMKILQFAFGGTRTSSFLPHNYGRNFVVYTGTHDNETTLGWYQNASVDEQDHIRRYLARDGSNISWDMIRLAHASVADTVIVPVQDLLSLGNEARMNYPGQEGGWWTWRFKRGMLTDRISQRLAEISALFERTPPAS